MRTSTNAFPAAMLIVPLLSAVALAEDAGASSGPEDYRDKVFIACSLVFLAITVYLVLTHKKGASLDDDIAHLESRLSGLEK